MSFIQAFIGKYQDVLHHIAEIAVYTLELVGILIIVVGSVRAVVRAISQLRKKAPVNVAVSLGRALALALEFKMGSEIINTVIIRDIGELGILAVVIAIRALLAVLIHWEIMMEKKKTDLKS